MTRRALTTRELRKRLLRLEAEAFRLDMAVGLRELRDPMTHLRRAPSLLGWAAGSSRISALAAMAVSPRMRPIVKMLPLVLTGWRIAVLVRNLLAAKRAHAEESESDGDIAVS